MTRSCHRPISGSEGTGCSFSSLAHDIPKHASKAIISHFPLTDLIIFITLDVCGVSPIVVSKVSRKHHTGKSTETRDFYYWKTGRLAVDLFADSQGCSGMMFRSVQ